MNPKIEGVGVEGQDKNREQSRISASVCGIIARLKRGGRDRRRARAWERPRFSPL